VSTSASVKALEIPLSELVSLRNLYKAEKGSRHTPSIPHIKLVLLTLCVRQRKQPRMKFEFDVVNESIPQLMEETGLRKSTIDDVLAFLMWIGLCRTIRQGGGKGKNPTVRHIDFDGFVSGNLRAGTGDFQLRVGEMSFPDGELPQLIGELPDTPSLKPLLKPVCVPDSIQISHETGFEIDKIMDAYQPEINAYVIPSCDLDTLPEYEFIDGRMWYETQHGHTGEENYFQAESLSILKTLASNFTNDDISSRQRFSKEKSEWSL
jgi:hypothetical protein